MPDGYDTHADYMGWVEKDMAARQRQVLDALRNAFSRFIELREVEIINFSAMTAMDLAHAIGEYPMAHPKSSATSNLAISFQLSAISR